MQYMRQEITSFTSTNLVDEYNEWSPSTTYVLETDNNNLTNASMARLGTWYYRSLINNNLNFSPETWLDIKWVKYQVSNKYAMLDLSANSKSIFMGGNLTVTFLQEQMTTLGIGNFEAEYVTFEILALDGTTVLWSLDTLSSTNENVTDYYSYIYEEYGYIIDRTLKVDLPVIGEYVRLTFHKSGNSDRTACGYLVGGTPVDMGKTLMGVKFNFTSYAVKKVDAFGALTITKRAVQDLVDFETTMNAEQLPYIRREIKKVYNNIVLFILDENSTGNYENLLTLGVIQDASVLLKNHVEVTMGFSIMESI